MDITQIVIMVSLISITAIIVGCGFWFISLLKELKVTIIKTNGILDDAKMITASVAEPVSSISEFVQGFRNGVAFFNSLFKKNKS
jgi:hypothetical protein